MADLLLLSRADLEKTLDFPSVIEALAEAFRGEQRGEWDTPKRIAAHTKGGGLLAMPCGGGAPEALGAKLVTTFSANTKLGLPGVAGLYALFDPTTGVPLAVMDGAYLTLVRTAAVSALATKLLARGDAASLGVFGAGAQAEFHVRLIATVRPIESVIVWARRTETAEAVVARLKAHHDLRAVKIFRVAAMAQEAAACDVVVTATAATAPVLLGSWLKEGSHVNAIGTHTPNTREIDTEAVTRASILVAETADTLLEAGDLQMAEREAGSVVTRVETLGKLLTRSAASPDATRPHPSSVFKSCGVAFEDLAVAAIAFERARKMDLGSRFAFS